MSGNRAVMDSEKVRFTGRGRFRLVAWSNGGGMRSGIPKFLRGRDKIWGEGAGRLAVGGVEQRRRHAAGGQRPEVASSIAAQFMTAPGRISPKIQDAPDLHGFVLDCVVNRARKPIAQAAVIAASNR